MPIVSAPFVSPERALFELLAGEQFANDLVLVNVSLSHHMYTEAYTDRSKNCDLDEETSNRVSLMMRIRARYTARRTTSRYVNIFTH